MYLEMDPMEKIPEYIEVESFAYCEQNKHGATRRSSSGSSVMRDL